MVRLRERFGLLQATAPMCAFGSAYLKYFTLIESPSMGADLDSLACRVCTKEGAHARHAHAGTRPGCGR